MVDFDVDVLRNGICGPKERRKKKDNCRLERTLVVFVDSIPQAGQRISRGASSSHRELHALTSFTGGSAHQMVFFGITKDN